ncbi:MAG: hypothetical protein ACFFD4_10595 [Candidatus Odinarchaeota archaeon]
MAIKKNKNLESFLALAARYLVSRNLEYEILLFGSRVKDSHMNKRFQAVSDTDLLVIVDTKDLEKSEWTRLIGYFEMIDETIFGRRTRLPAFLRALNHLTGMFRNVFVTRLDTLEKKEFASLFSVSRAASFLIPAEKIIQNVLGNQIHLAGQRYVNRRIFGAHWSSKGKEKEQNNWLRSLTLNLLLSLGSLFLLPFFYESTLYAMEAVKWSLLNVEDFPSGREMRTTNDILLARIHKEKGLKQQLLYRLLLLRQNYKQDVIFSFFAPFLVLSVHLEAFRSSKEFFT